MQNINKATETFLNQTLGQLDKHEHYVFWIRDGEMTRQIYQGKNFAKIWQQEIHKLFLNILLCGLIIFKIQAKDFYMHQFQRRHNTHYNNPELNRVYYQIKRPDNSIKFI